MMNIEAPDQSHQSTTWAILARRSARQQRRAIEAGDHEAARLFAQVTAQMIDRHLATLAVGTAEPR